MPSLQFFISYKRFGTDMTVCFDTCTVELLMNHYDVQHSAPVFECLKCNLKLQNRAQFELHFAKCRIANLLDICDFCPTIFELDKPLDKFNHIKTHLINADAGAEHSNFSKNVFSRGINSA